MTRSSDERIEKRAIELARDNKLEWVKRPRQQGQPDTPDAATNDERNGYRQQARDKDESDTTSAPPR